MGPFLQSTFVVSALLASLISSGCSGLFYDPSQETYVVPSETRGAVPIPKDVWFEASGGMKLHGWSFTPEPENEKPRALIVFFHGNGENLTSHFLALSWIVEHGYAFFIFDYAGYGQSPGSPSPEQTLEDGKAALRWARKTYPKVPLVVFGQSLGGAVGMRSVIDLKDEIPVRLVVVDSTFASYKSVGAAALRKSFITWLFSPLAYLFLSDSHAPGEDIAKISPVPLVVMHGEEDDVVPFGQGAEVYELARQPKELWRIPGGRHIDAFMKHEGRYRKRFLEKLDEVLGEHRVVSK